MNTARSEHFACGTQTAGLAAGGAAPVTSNSEEYNGTAWSEGNNLGTARSDFAFQFGIQTAAVAAGGYISTASALNEEYDGTSWSEVNNIPTGTFQGGGLGTQTAGLGFGGYTTATVADSFSYDGTNWTASSDLNLARRVRITNFGASADSGYVYGGITPAGNRQTTGSEWNGSSWTAAPASTSIGKQNSNGGGAASSTAGWAAAGNVAPNNVASTTEEFNQSTNTITAAAWASGGALNSARFQMAGAGTQTAGLAFGGYEPGGESGKTEEYNGTSFSEQNDMGTARYEMGNGSGTQTAALCSAGRTDTAHGGGAQAFVEEYDGTSWSEVNNLPGNRTAHGSAGPQTASIIALGKSAPPAPSVVTTSLHYDGTNWTSGGSTNTARFAAFGAGTQTSAIFAGGNPSLATAEEYNGSAWTTTGSLIAGAQGPSAAGADSDAALFTSGGNGGTGSGVAETSSYNGTVFVSAPQLASERGYAAGFGIQTSAVVAGGLRSSGVTTTEEFTAETETANIKDFTTS
jgi:hypothetical protein